MSKSERAADDELQSAAAVREHARALLDAAERGELEHWHVERERLGAVSERVERVTRAAYGDWSKVPYHSRFRHFDVGGVERLRAFEARIAHESDAVKLMTRIELAITSVLLDAGAGADWSYREADARTYRRSEGLAVASYHLFLAGALASPRGALRADARGLLELDSPALFDALQVSEQNPLVGGEGRVRLLQRLGDVVASDARHFSGAEPARLGALGLFLSSQANAGHLPASAVLDAVLAALGPIWQRPRSSDAQAPLGDVFRHSRHGWIPFHKLSQWLAYSLFEPLEWAGLHIDDMDAMTGLAEYRNGGLFVDAGVLVLRQPAAIEQVHAVDSDLVIEWRALTVALLDELAADIRARAGLSREALPLARVLEGGSWRAGREIASERRPDGRPPLRILSDGTVF